MQTSWWNVLSLFKDSGISYEYEVKWRKTWQAIRHLPEAQNCPESEKL